MSAPEAARVRYQNLTDAEKERALRIVARAGSPVDGSRASLKVILGATVQEMHDLGLLPGWEPPAPLSVEQAAAIQAVAQQAAAALAYNHQQIARMSGIADEGFKR